VRFGVVRPDFDRSSELSQTVLHIALRLQSYAEIIMGHRVIRADGNRLSPLGDGRLVIALRCQTQGAIEEPIELAGRYADVQERVR
jgi:hypothetical protein